MKAVIDTNQLLRLAAAYQRSPLFAAWRVGRFEIVVSEEIMAELHDVARRSKVSRFLAEAYFHQFIFFLQAWAIAVVPVTEFPHCRDPKDDMIIATAVAAQADFIVTTDNDFLDDRVLRTRLQNEFNIRVAQPAEFLAALG